MNLVCAYNLHIFSCKLGIIIILLVQFLQEIKGTLNIFFTRPRPVSAFEVQCEMPFSILEIDIRWASIIWLLSVSNDNVTFSETTTVFVFDSKCLDCTDDTFICRQKVRLQCTLLHVYTSVFMYV